MNAIKDIPFAEDVNYSMFAASHLARAEGTEITLRLFIAGLYLGCFERLLGYFVDWSKATTSIARNFKIEKPIWTYWAEMYQEMISDKDLGMHTFSPDTIKVLDDAANIARERAENAILNLADILTAIDKNRQMDLCKIFVESGLDAALFGRRSL